MTDKSKEGEEAFLSRWSRRKNIEETEQPITKIIPNSDVLENANIKISSETEIAPQLTDAEKEAEELEKEENRAAAESIDLEALNYESDFQLFMKKGVPETLKNQAMRKLWISNPILANVDGLNDYDENFADPALNTFKSIWKVGRGFLTDEDDQKELERKQALEKEKVLADKDEATGEQSVGDENSTENQDGTSAPPNAIPHSSNVQSSSGHSPNSNIRLDEAPQPIKVKADPIEMNAETDNLVVDEEPPIKRVSIRKRILDS